MSRSRLTPQRAAYAPSRTRVFQRAACARVGSTCQENCAADDVWELALALGSVFGTQQQAASSNRADDAGWRCKPADPGPQ